MGEEVSPRAQEGRKTMDQMAKEVCEADILEQDGVLYVVEYYDGSRKELLEEFGSLENISWINLRAVGQFSLDHREEAEALLAQVRSGEVDPDTYDQPATLDLMGLELISELESLSSQASKMADQASKMAEELKDLASKAEKLIKGLKAS